MDKKYDQGGNDGSKNEDTNKPEQTARWVVGVEENQAKKQQTNMGIPSITARKKSRLTVETINQFIF